jgi:hypothetical protein
MQEQRHFQQNAKNEQDQYVNRRLLLEEINHAAMLLIKFDFSKANVIAIITRKNQLVTTYLFPMLGHKLITPV